MSEPDIQEINKRLQQKREQANAAGPHRIEETLQTFLSPPLAVKSRPKLCPRCQHVRSLGLFDICAQCHRKMMFSAMPPDEQEFAIACVIPPRYLEARLLHLPDKLQDRIKSLP